MIAQVFKFLVEIVVYGGGSVAIAYLAFQKFGEKWIKNKFDKNLEAYKHQQNLEIQRLRVKIDSMLSRVLKIQEKEFEVLPEAWSKLDKVYIMTTGFVSPIQRSPDFDFMNDKELEEFLSKTDFWESQKNKIRNSSDKSETYSQINFQKRLNDVTHALTDFQTYIARNGIFLPLALKEIFENFHKKLSALLIEKELAYHSINTPNSTAFILPYQKIDELLKEVAPLYKSIETEIQSRLHPHDT